MYEIFTNMGFFGLGVTAGVSFALVPVKRMMRKAVEDRMEAAASFKEAADTWERLQNHTKQSGIRVAEHAAYELANAGFRPVQDFRVEVDQIQKSITVVGQNG